MHALFAQLASPVDLSTEMSPGLAVMISVDFDSDVALRTQIPISNRFQHSKLKQWLKVVRIFRVSADNVSK